MSRDNLLKGRYSAANQVYHVTSCTKGRKPLFLEFSVARLLIEEITWAKTDGYVDNLAWVLMPDHLHWLFTLNDKAELSVILKQVKARSSQKINSYHGTSGSIWQRGFYDQAIRHEEDIIKTARYIVANPLRADIVDNIGDYPFWDAKWL